MVQVSNSSQLASALRSAGSGTMIELTSGTYSLNLRSGDFHDAVITEAAGATATFSKVELRGASHLTFDGVNFNLPTATKGIVIADSSDITIQNSNISGSTAQGTKGIFVNGTDDFTLVNNQITGFATAMALSHIDGLTVQGNAFTGASWDAMIAGGIHNALFADNDISLNNPAERRHTDAMQFYNNGGSPMSNVTIRDNHIETNGRAHGIYIANADADARGASAFFHNLVIDHNTLLVSNTLALAVGQTDGLIITDNTVLRDMRLGSGNTPIIRVQQDSTDVEITGNISHKAPTASLGGSGNWKPLNKVMPDWHVADNTIVPLGTTVGNASSRLASADLQAAAAPEPSINPSADIFRFDSARGTHLVRGLDFSQGDSIVLHDHARGTFHAQSGGNPLTVSADGTSVTIDQVDHLRELDRASNAGHSREGKHDTLALDMDQPGGGHMVQVLDIAHAYF